MIKVSVILWMDKILHHFESMGNHCLLLFTRGNHPSRPSWVVQDSVHPQQGFLMLPYLCYGRRIGFPWGTGHLCFCGSVCFRVGTLCGVGSTEEGQRDRLRITASEGRKGDRSPRRAPRSRCRSSAKTEKVCGVCVGVGVFNCCCLFFGGGLVFLGDTTRKRRTQNAVVQ